MASTTFSECTAQNRMLPCDLVTANTVHLQVTIHWDLHADRKGSAFTCGAGSFEKPALKAKRFLHFGLSKRGLQPVAVRP